MEKGKTTENGSRLLSLDALRGFDMLFIMGFAGLLGSICSLFPDGADCFLAQQMKHVVWEGFHHHDTIFALFLFISGMTFPFSLSKKRLGGVTDGKIVLGIIRRALVLIFLGLVYNGFFQLDFAHLRLPSVLARIGIAWAVAAIIYMFTGKKFQWVIAVSILVGYWLLLRFCQAPDAPAGAGPYSLEGNIAYYLDRCLLGAHSYKPTGDPEGLLSTVPAIVTAMLGMFTGRYVQQSGDSGRTKTLKLLVAAVVMGAAAWIWSIWFPVIKSLWTSTFVLACGAYSIGMFAIFYYLIDVKLWRKGVLFFQVIGMNSITIYIGQRIISFWGISKFFFGGLAGLCGSELGDVIIRFGALAVSWYFLYFLYKHKVFLKV